MIELTQETYKRLEDLHLDLERCVLNGRGGVGLSEVERVRLALLAGTLVRAFELPQDEFEALLPDFRAKAKLIGERLGAGATVEEAIVSDTKYCVQAD